MAWDLSRAGVEVMNHQLKGEIVVDFDKMQMEFDGLTFGLKESAMYMVLESKGELLQKARKAYPLSALTTTG